MLGVTWSVWDCLGGGCSLGVDGEGELRGQLANPVHLKKWPLKPSVCVCVLF